MAARRVRIKGIANIPVRRKAEIATTESQNVDNCLQKSNNKDISDVLAKTAVESNDSSIVKSERSDQEVKLPVESLKPDTSTISTKLGQDISLKEDKCKNPTECAKSQVKSKEILEDCVQEKQLENKSVRRWVPRPLVRIPAVPRKIKSLEDDVQDNKSDTSVPSPRIINDEIVDTFANKSLNVEITNGSTTENLPDENIKLTASEKTLLSPLSPNKAVNRIRIRPVPRFIRRNSVQGSASESEDDARNRTRNDSVCSLPSLDGNVKDDTVAKEKQIK